MTALRFRIQPLLPPLTTACFPRVVWGGSPALEGFGSDPTDGELVVWDGFLESQTTNLPLVDWWRYLETISESTLFFKRQLDCAGFKGFKLMEIMKATAVFQLERGTWQCVFLKEKTRGNTHTHIFSYLKMDPNKWSCKHLWAAPACFAGCACVPTVSYGT